MLKLKGKKLIVRGVVTIVLVAGILFEISSINQAVGTNASTGGTPSVFFQDPPPGSQTTGNFQHPADGGHFDGPKGHGGEDRGGSSIWNVIHTYSGILVIVSAITYSLGIRILWKRRKIVNAEAN